MVFKSISSVRKNPHNLELDFLRYSLLFCKKFFLCGNQLLCMIALMLNLSFISEYLKQRCELLQTAVTR